MLITLTLVGGGVWFVFAWFAVCVGVGVGVVDGVFNEMDKETGPGWDTSTRTTRGWVKGRGICTKDRQDRTM